VGLDGGAQEAKVDAQAVKMQKLLLASVRRRVALRDASRLEEDQASAAVGAAAAQASRSAGRVVVARARLTAQFLPCLAGGSARCPGALTPPGGLPCCMTIFWGKATSWPQHRPLPVRQKRRRTVPARSEGDPTFGLRVFPKRAAWKREAVVFSMPFGGGYRSAQADRASAQASAAQADLQAVRLSIDETADTDLAGAQVALAAWRCPRSA
jgi:hypothetical protein